MSLMYYEFVDPYGPVVDEKGGRQVLYSGYGDLSNKEYYNHAKNILIDRVQHMEHSPNSCIQFSIEPVGGYQLPSNESHKE